MSMMNTKAPVVMALILIAIAVLGEALILTADRDDSSSEVTLADGSLEAVISSRGSHVYNAVVMDDSYGSPDHLYIYFDPSYGSAYSDVKVAVGARPLNQENYVNQIVNTLKVRGLTDCSIVDADALRNVIYENGKGIALVCISGALPDTVYDGASESSILEWIKSGGRLYWAGNIIGSYIGHPGSVEKTSNGTSLFLGSECVDDEMTESYVKIKDNGFTEALSVINNNVRYSVKESELPSDRTYLGYGYTDGERASVGLVGLGEGMIGIFGGDYSDYQRIDMAQAIASGISPDAVLIENSEGSVHGTVRIELMMGENVYIYLGGDLPVYGQLHEVS